LAHPGVFLFRVRVLGRSAHAGLAHTGVNAIGKMNQVYQALVALDERRAREKHHPLLEASSGRSCHLNIGTYRAGDWIATVAGWAEIGCRMSYLPGEDAEEVKAEVQQTVAEVAQRDEWLRQHPPQIIWLETRADPWEQDPTHPFVTTFRDAAAKVYPSPFPLVGATWGMDTRLAPSFNMPAISFGPEGANVHGVNEYVDLTSVITCTKILASFIMDWCGVA